MTPSTLNPRTSLEHSRLMNRVGEQIALIVETQGVGGEVVAGGLMMTWKGALIMQTVYREDLYDLYCKGE